MKKFKSLVDNAIRQTQLVRVRLKVDPALCADGEILKYQGYEGYVLAERGDKVRVCVESCDDVITVSCSMLEPISASPIDILKHAALGVMKTRLTNPLSMMIVAANTPEALETYMREHGASVDDLLSMYRVAYQSSI